MERKTIKLSTPEYERIRAQYRPEVVRILLVGESRPEQGTFFYNGDSKLFRYTHNVFCRVLDVKFGSADEFLQYFRKAGFYLDDLCLKPVNNMNSHNRESARKAGVTVLAKRIKTYSPDAVICLMKGITPQVRKAVSGSGVNLELGFHSVPFPSKGNQPLYQSEMERVLKKMCYT